MYLSFRTDDRSRYCTRAEKLHQNFRTLKNWNSWIIWTMSTQSVLSLSNPILLPQLQNLFPPETTKSFLDLLSECIVNLFRENYKRGKRCIQISTTKWRTFSGNNNFEVETKDTLIRRWGCCWYKEFQYSSLVAFLDNEQFFLLPASIHKSSIETTVVTKKTTNITNQGKTQAKAWFFEEKLQLRTCCWSWLPRWHSFIFSSHKIFVLRRPRYRCYFPFIWKVKCGDSISTGQHVICQTTSVLQFHRLLKN